MIKYLSNINFVFWNLQGRPSNSKWSGYFERHPEDVAFRKAMSVMSRISFQKPRLAEVEKEGLYNAIVAHDRACNRFARIWSSNKFFAIVRRVAVVAVVLAVIGWAAMWSIKSDNSSLQPQTETVLALSSVEMPSAITVVNDNTPMTLDAVLMAHIELNSLGGITVNGQQVAQMSADYVDVLVPQPYRAVVTLADKSKIWLNENSKLRLFSQSGTKARSAEIDGEGYFEVTTNPEHPFRVVSQELVAVVKGTSFDICSTSNPCETQYVVLVKGCVDVEMPTIGESVTLAPSQVLNYNNNCYMTTYTDVGVYTNWREESIVINDDGIVEIVAKLSEYYGVAVECDSNVSKLSCSGRLLLFDDIKQTLDVLTNIIPVRYKWRGETLYIESN